MAGDAELMFAGDRVANGGHLVAMKLDQLVALLAVQVVVLRIAVVVLVDGAAPSTMSRSRPASTSSASVR